MFFYSLLLTLAFIAALPYFAYQAIFKRKYLSNLRERLGRLPTDWRDSAQPTIWLHAVSVGETLAARPLIAALRRRFPDHRLIVSTTTATGQAVARTLAAVDGVCYFPFDWRFAVRRALGVIEPRIVILMESELWPNFLRECRRRGIPVLVANGRISDRSFARARRFVWLTRRMYALPTRMLMQSAVDAERAVLLGAPAECVGVSGNLKYDIGDVNESAQAQWFEETFALSAAPLIIAGSTCEGEEEIVIEAFARVRATPGLERVRLLIAPRHPERFDEAAAQASKAPGGMIRRSACDQTEPTRAAVILLDSIGELAALYHFAAAVFVGGSLVPKGGHNILEPALHAKPIIVGPQMENFREIAAEFERRDALIKLRGNGVDELSDALIALLKDDARARQLGANARAAVAANRGATAYTVAAVAELIAPRAAEVLT